MALLDISGLDYRCNQRSPWLFQGFNLSIAAGELVQLIGNSGSGKTTLTDMIAGWRKPSAGNIYVSGSVSVVSQMFSLYSDLTVSENLEFYSQINDRKFDKSAIFNWISLSKMANIKVNRLPAGYRRILQIAVAVNRDFSLLIVDEADAELDQIMQSQVMQMFQNLKDTGKGILALTSRPTADPAFDRILIMRNGKAEKADALEQIDTISRVGVKA